MRAYTKYKERTFSYPEQMQKILEYLKAHGELHIQPITVEKLYYRFSDEKYCASWMSIDNELLEEFAEWLSEYDV